MLGEACRNLIDKANLAHSRQAFYHRAILSNDNLHSRVDTHLNGNGGFLLDADLLAQCADFNDKTLQHSHIDLCNRIRMRFITLRILRQRNRLSRRVAVIERVPDFFGNKWHEGREQPQRGFKNRNQRGERRTPAITLAGLLTR